MLKLFEKYAMLLEKQFSKRFKDVCPDHRSNNRNYLLTSYSQIMMQNDYISMQIDAVTERGAVFKVLWLTRPEYEEMSK